MTFSKLINRENLTSKYSSRQGNSIEWVIWHHAAGTNNSSGESVLVHGSKKVSCTYLLRSDKQLVGIVPEEFRPWTTGWDADKHGITFETINTTGAPNWEVSDWQIEKGIELVADIAFRYGWEEINDYRLRQHNEFAATACPGPFIKSKWNYIKTKANQRLREMRNPVSFPQLEELQFFGLKTPFRFMDTRDNGRIGPLSRLKARTWYTVTSPYTGKGLQMNLVAVGPSGDGWALANPSPTTNPTSKVNYLTGRAIANEVYVPLNGNKFSLFASTDVDLVIDISGVWQ